MKKNPYRLNRVVVPEIYEIEIEPDLEAFTFKGTETIQLRAGLDFSEITLHAADIKIQDARLETKAGVEAVRARRISYDTKFETATLDFGRVFRPGKAMFLRLRFTGNLNDKMHGFYRTSYQVRGEKRWGAATQFEATDARRAFPCWDEPDSKARFRMALVVPKRLTALSNMPVVQEEEMPGGKKRVRYALTPVMPTYLVALVVAELECLEGKDSQGTVVRIYTTPGKKEQGRFALEVARHALPYFAKWFGIPYALPKCDMVALPDFASGAMENWGLVTYRETALLVDEKNSSASAKQRVAEVIDHELAHQWFGNLVTMRWWTDLWLNEGFASYMGPKAVHDQFPEWKIWDQFVVADYLRGLHDDALKNTHPIEIPVQNPAEIREIFDAITYSKGSSVNRMLEHYLGETAFRNGLRAYLKQFAYGNATTRELWSALEKASGKPVRSMMASYTDQPGYPLLTVRAKKDARTFEIEQKRFVFDGSADPKNPLWKVPVVIRGEKMKKPWVGLLTARKTSIRLPGDPGDWIKVNAGQSGFYRVAYEDGLAEGLVRAISGGNLPDRTIDTLGILSDALALARAGYAETPKALELFRAVRNEREYNVWTIVAGGLQSIGGLLDDNETAKKDFASFALSLVAPAARDLGWEKKKGDSHSDLLLRSLLLYQAGRYGDSGVVSEAKSRFETFTKKGALEPNLRGPVYSLVAENGGPAEFGRLVEIYRKNPLQEERVRILRAFSRLRDDSAVSKALDFALSKDVRNQDAYVVLAGFGGNPFARDAAWTFVKRHFAQLRERYQGGSVSLLGHILEGSVTGFKTREGLKDAEKFFRAHPVEGTERTLKQALEIIRSNIRWREKAADDVASWVSRET